MRISDWSSDVCSSDLPRTAAQRGFGAQHHRPALAVATADAQHAAGFALVRVAAARSQEAPEVADVEHFGGSGIRGQGVVAHIQRREFAHADVVECSARRQPCVRSEEHTSELQSLMRTSYAVFCLKKK